MSNKEIYVMKNLAVELLAYQLNITKEEYSSAQFNTRYVNRFVDKHRGPGGKYTAGYTGPGFAYPVKFELHQRVKRVNKWAINPKNWETALKEDGKIYYELTVTFSTYDSEYFKYTNSINSEEELELAKYLHELDQSFTQEDRHNINLIWQIVFDKARQIYGQDFDVPDNPRNISKKDYVNTAYHSDDGIPF
jgi:hypothetical protein